MRQEVMLGQHSMLHTMQCLWRGRGGGVECGRNDYCNEPPDEYENVSFVGGGGSIYNGNGWWNMQWNGCLAHTGIRWMLKGCTDSVEMLAKNDLVHLMVEYRNHLLVKELSLNLNVWKQVTEQYHP